MKKIFLILLILSATQTYAMMDDKGKGNSNSLFNVPIYAKKIMSFNRSAVNNITFSSNNGETLVFRLTPQTRKINIDTALIIPPATQFPQGLRRLVTALTTTNTEVILKTISFEDANKPPYFDPNTNQRLVEVIPAGENKPYLMKVKEKVEANRPKKKENIKPGKQTPPIFVSDEIRKHYDDL